MDVVRHDAVPGRPYAAAVVAEGRFVFVSGQIPVRDGRLVAGTMREQTRAVMDNIVAILDSTMRRGRSRCRPEIDRPGHPARRRELAEVRLLGVNA